MRALTDLLGARNFETAGIKFALPKVGRWLGVMAERRRLGALTDAQLSDIGVTREAASAEAARPFWDHAR